jgi:structural maintenance of chromosome 2
VLGIS